MMVMRSPLLRMTGSDVVSSSTSRTKRFFIQSGVAMSVCLGLCVSRLPDASSNAI